MKKKRITITGGSGFVGQMLRRGLETHDYEIDVFDQYRSELIDIVRRYFLATSDSSVCLKFARRIKKALMQTERMLVGSGIVRPSSDNILDMQSRLVKRFSGSDAVIHLAGLAHEHIEGATPGDFHRINYEGSINVFEAARAAGVPKFIFASSAQVYKINEPIQIAQFPILESNYCPSLEEGQSLYGWLKLRVEQYLTKESGHGSTQSIALRLEMPGTRSPFPYNFYISTSIENLVSGFVCAIESKLTSGFDAFNLADAVVDERIVNIPAFLAAKWSHVPNHTKGNQCLLSTEKARELLNYQPCVGGTYYDASVIWG